jgi:hypothetical protein
MAISFAASNSASRSAETIGSSRSGTVSSAAIISWADVLAMINAANHDIAPDRRHGNTARVRFTSRISRRVP